MKAYLRIPLLLLITGVIVALGLTAIVTGAYFYVEPGVPEAEKLREVRFQIPLRVYSRDGRLMAQFGEQKRTPVSYDRIPKTLIDAVLAAEDDTFFEHPGLDFTGTARAIFNYVITGGDETVAGGSTITQQIPRTMDFLSARDRTLGRKIKEWVLAFRIEQEFTKPEILELFLNTTFFGQSSYGVIAAARTYFDKELDELTLSEMAVIAGIPPAPSDYNPYNGPQHAASRRAYVLRRMRDLGWITEAQRSAALAEPIISRRFGRRNELEADYVAEMVRAELIERLGPAAYTDGLKVTTTIDSRLQKAANESLRATLKDYDERHGYRGPVAHLDLSQETLVDAAGQPNEARLKALLADYGEVIDLEAALVVSVDEEAAQVFLRSGSFATIGLDAVSWARRYINENRTDQAPAMVADVLAPGDIVRMRRLDDGSLRLGQLPDVQGAIVALDPMDGAVVSLVGGFDYFLNNYNRATQTLRQPGSSFKPFIYSAALEHGKTLASIINDAPIVEASAALETTWKPANFEGRSHGETRLREALKRSMNLAAIRTLRDVGVTATIQHVRKFGFDSRATPADGSLALGSGGVSPLTLANAYATFANGGYRVSPYFIERIEDAEGDVLYESSRSVEVVCRRDDTEVTQTCDAETTAHGRAAVPELALTTSALYPNLRRAARVVSPQNVYLMTDILHDVARSGSGAAAYRALRRTDIAGKTGTTNGPTDAWFAGFNADIVTVAWVGFDDNRLLGTREQGGVTAIPMWIGYMREALEGQPEHVLARPPGIVEARINPTTGLVASDANPDAIWEKFRVGHLPPREPDTPYNVAQSVDSAGQPAPAAAADAPIF